MSNQLVALLARHGEIEANTQSIWRGWINEPLEEEGLSEAKDAAKKLSKYPVRRIISSPFTRAIETARCYGKVFGLEIEQEAALMPFSTGIFTSLDKEDTKDAYQLFMDNPEISIPNGESVDNIHRRIAEFFGPALKESERNLTLFVAHSSTAVCISNLLLGKLDMYPGLDEVVAPGGVVGIYADGEGYRIEVLIEEHESAQIGS
jgi:broad specificity phosphatase PhoE